MERAEACDVVERRVEVLDDAHRQDLVEELLAVVVGPRRNRLHPRPLQDGERGRVAAELDAGVGERAAHRRQELPRRAPVHEEALERVADARALDLAVQGEVHRLLHRRALVEEEVADALVVLHHGHPRPLRHRADERRSAARDREVDEVVELQQGEGRRAVRRRHDLRGRRGEPGLREPLRERRGERERGAERVGAGAQDGRVPALQAERGRVDRHVRPRLVHHEDDAERDPDLLHRQAVRPPPARRHLPDRIRQRRDVEEGLRDPLEPLLVEREAVEVCRRLAALARRLEVLRVLREDPPGATDDRLRGGAEGIVLRLRGRVAERARSVARRLGELPHLGGEVLARFPLHLAHSRPGSSTTRSSRWTISSRYLYPSARSISLVFRPAMRRTSSAP